MARAAGGGAGEGGSLEDALEERRAICEADGISGAALEAVIEHQRLQELDRMARSG